MRESALDSIAHRTYVSCLDLCFHLTTHPLSTSFLHELERVVQRDCSCFPRSLLQVFRSCFAVTEMPLAIPPTRGWSMEIRDIAPQMFLLHIVSAVHSVFDHKTRAVLSFTPSSLRPIPSLAFPPQTSLSFPKPIPLCSFIDIIDIITCHTPEPHPV
jgi:hypothetical protein